MRKALARTDRVFRRQGDSSGAGAAGRGIQGLKEEDLPQFKQLAKDNLEFALFTLQVFKDIVLKNPST
jgi:hypothetical protein